MATEKQVLPALKKFADSVTKKFRALALGDPEDQLRGPLEQLIQDVGKALSIKVVCKGESRLPGRLGKPDYAVIANRLLAGFVEFKAPDNGFAGRFLTFIQEHGETALCGVGRMRHVSLR